MPRNGSGIYTPPSSPGAFNPAIAGQPATPTAWNTLLADLTAAMTQSIASDGQTVITGDLPMSGFKHTGVGDASAADEYLAAGQITSGFMGADDTGAANAYVIAPTFAISAYAKYQTFQFQATHANTGASTLAVSGLAAKAIKHPDGSALLQGDIPLNGIVYVQYDGTNFQLLSVTGVTGTSTAYQGNNTFAGTTSFSNTLTMVAAAINGAARDDIASAATMNIGAATTNYLRVSGTATVTSLGTIASGVARWLVFSGALTLTHNNTSLFLPNGGNNILTVPSDTALFISNGSGNWKCLCYIRADGTALQQPTGSQAGRAYTENTSYTTITANIPADNSIPQVGEGTQILSVSITPKAAANRVRAMVKVPLSFTGGGSGLITAALFRNGGSNAIDSTVIHPVDGTGTYPAVLIFEDSPGSTSAQTYTVRVGGDSSDVVINGDFSGRLGGGSARAAITLDEFVG